MYTYKWVWDTPMQKCIRSTSLINQTDNIFSLRLNEYCADTRSKRGELLNSGDAVCCTWQVSYGQWWDIEVCWTQVAERAQCRKHAKNHHESESF